jgi:hypothetical protein
MVAGNFGGAIIGQILEKICAPQHSAHGVPVGMVPNRPFHNQRFTLHVDGHFRARLQIKALPHGFGNGDLPFRRYRRYGRAGLLYQGKTDSQPVQVDSPAS